MVILQRSGETPRRVRAEPDLLEEQPNVMVLE
jgi:hypothetical protein